MHEDDKGENLCPKTGDSVTVIRTSVKKNVCNIRHMHFG